MDKNCWFLKPQKCIRLNFCWGFAPDHAGGSYIAPPPTPCCSSSVPGLWRLLENACHCNHCMRHLTQFGVTVEKETGLMKTGNWKVIVIHLNCRVGQPKTDGFCSLFVVVCHPTVWIANLDSVTRRTSGLREQVSTLICWFTSIQRSLISLVWKCCTELLYSVTAKRFFGHCGSESCHYTVTRYFVKCWLVTTHSELCRVLFLVLSVTFLVCIWNISGSAEWICAKFTWKMCLVPNSVEFECQGQGHHVSTDKNGIFGRFGGLRAFYVW